ncbi:MAG: AraC family transcriptional regulator [Bacteroidota bacterium]
MYQGAKYQIVVDKNRITSEHSSNAFHCETTDTYTIKMVLGGQASYIVGNRELTLSPGSFLFLNCGTKYCNRISSGTQVNTYSLLFDPAFVRNRGRDDTNPHFVESIYPLKGDMQVSLERLKTYTDCGQVDLLCLAEYLNSCLLNYYALYHAEVTDRADSLQFLSNSTRSEILRRLSIAKDYIISNYNKNIRLDDIALAACLSVNHLLRTFKQAYGQSPYQFLTEFRLLQAKYYLKNTGHPIHEIVDMVGFECPSSFIRLFKSSFQITPGRYR